MDKICKAISSCPFTSTNLFNIPFTQPSHLIYFTMRYFELVQRIVLVLAAYRWAAQYIGPAENMVLFFLPSLSHHSECSQLARLHYRLEISLHASIRVFEANADNAENAATEPVLQHELDIGTIVLPRNRREQYDHENGDDGNVQGEGGRGEAR